MRAGRHCRGAAAGLTLVLLMRAFPAPLRADVEELTLYQRTARATLVVRALALSSATRKPRLRVIEVLKGSYGAEELTVIPHFEDNTRPTPWLDREVFRAGEESILFMLPYVDEFRRSEGPETFSLLGAARGKVAVPTEGSGALLEAIRRFSAILAMGQHDEQAEGILSLLKERNPYLIEAGLQESLRFSLARPEDGTVLLSLLDHVRPGFRAGALRLLAQVVRDGLVSGEGAGVALPGGRAALLERGAGLMRLDSAVEVRLAAIELVSSLGGEGARVLLEEAGRRDTVQSVRYAAQVAAHALRPPPE